MSLGPQVVVRTGHVAIVTVQLTRTEMCPAMNEPELQPALSAFSTGLKLVG